MERGSGRRDGLCQQHRHNRHEEETEHHLFKRISTDITSVLRRSGKEFVKDGEASQGVGMGLVLQHRHLHQQCETEYHQRVSSDITSVLRRTGEEFVKKRVMKKASA